MLTRLKPQVFAEVLGGVLAQSPARQFSNASFRFAGALAITFALTPAPARADNIADSCLRAPGALSCVSRWSNGPGSVGNANIRPVAAPDARDAAEAAERERKWVARCKPTLRQDSLGVARYRYAAPGCEYGKYQD